MRLAALLLSSVLVGHPAASEPALPGLDDPALAAATAIWLTGDDENALPELSRLAREGSTPAQILLDRIRSRGLAATSWVEALPEGERRALFRHMDTRFGTPWMKVAAETSPMAQHFASLLTARNGRDLAEGALAFALASRGEVRAAASALRRLLNQGDWTEAMRLEEAAAATGLAPLAWAAATWVPDARRARRS